MEELLEYMHTGFRSKCSGFTSACKLLAKDCPYQAKTDCAIETQILACGPDLGICEKEDHCDQRADNHCA